METTDQPKNPFTKETLNEKWKNCNIGHTEDNKLIYWQEFFFIDIAAVNQAYNTYRQEHIRISETSFFYQPKGYNGNLTVWQPAIKITSVSL